MEDDRISNLPEEVLSHILSFLPTKKAVATSVLSKKWKSLWRSLPTLDFDDANYAITKEDYARFVQSVYAVILSRNLLQPIQKFRLNCVFSPYCHIANIKIWLNAVVQCGGLHHLDISIGYQQLTPAIFTCKTLVVLKLQLVDLKPLNSSVDLPFLTTLHMEDVFFSKLGCLAELLSGCPVLEDFKAENLEFGSQLTDKEFKTLPKLVRAEFSMMDKLFLMKVVSNVEFLHLNGFGWELSHDEHPGTDPYFPMFHNLTRLELFYRHCNNDWGEVVEFLKYCPKLQALLIEQPHLHGHAFDGFEEVGDWQYPPSVPECILLQLKSCYLNDYRGTGGEFQFARYILHNGIFLKRMTICSESTVSRQGKHKNFKKLSSCTRSSTTCELSFK